MRHKEKLAILCVSTPRTQGLRTIKKELSPIFSVPACFEKHFLPKLLLLLLTVSETLVLFLKQEPFHGNAPVVY
jgi:hypothetical protein